MNKDIIKKIANNFGIVNQENKLIEELSELIKELSILHQENSKAEKDNVVEEMSDVIILIYQLIYLYKVDEKIEEIIEYKLNRTIQRIEQNYYK